MNRDFISEIREDLGKSIDTRKLDEARAEIARLEAKCKSLQKELESQRGISMYLEGLLEDVRDWSKSHEVDGWPVVGHVELSKILREATAENLELS